MFNYAEKIRRLRLERNMKQVELSEGICSQASISKIEKGIVAPDVELLAKLAERLGITLFELLDNDSDPRANLMTKQVVEYIEAKSYIQLENYQKTPDFPEYLNEWVTGVLLAEHAGTPKEALAHFDKALELLKDEKKKLDVLIKVQASLASAYILLKKDAKAMEVLKESATLAEQNECDFLVKQSTYLALAKLCEAQEKCIEAQMYSELGIKLTIENASLMNLDQLYVLLASSHAAQKNKLAALEALKRAKALADMTQNYQILPSIHYLKEDIENKL